MHSASRGFPSARTVVATLAVAALLALAAGVLAGSASAAPPGGIASGSETSAPAPEAAPVVEGTASAGTSKLVAGRAIAPAGAPLAVRRVIAAANRIRTRPYIWGGGHGRWWDGGYDCSGAVSFALHGGELLSSPLTSGSLAGWGEAGPGRWITVYANADHTYAVIAGLRWDTAGDESGTGPRWHESTAAAAGGRFVVRHPTGY